MVALVEVAALPSVAFGSLEVGHDGGSAVGLGADRGGQLPQGHPGGDAAERVEQQPHGAGGVAGYPIGVLKVASSMR